MFCRNELPGVRLYSLAGVAQNQWLVHVWYEVTAPLPWFTTLEDPASSGAPCGLDHDLCCSCIMVQLLPLPILPFSLPHTYCSWELLPYKLTACKCPPQSWYLRGCNLWQYSFPLLMCVYMCLSVTLWTVAYQAPLSIGFSRQGYWSELPFPTPGDPPNPEIEPLSPALAGGFFTTAPPGKPPLSMRPSLKWTMH